MIGWKRWVWKSSYCHLLPVWYADLSMPFSEKLPINTLISQYAASKKAAVAFAYRYNKQYGIDLTVVRYFTVFGH